MSKKTQSRFWRNLHPLIRRKRKPTYEDDTNYAILNAIDESLKDLEKETLKSRIQSSLKTATGKFLDEYGHFFGVCRKVHRTETDEEYRARIIGTLDITRGTNESIIRGIHRFLEDNTVDVRIEEPWKNIMFLNNPEHRMNGTQKFQGEYYHFAIINVYIGTPLEALLFDVIKQYKPAGVKFHITYDPNARPGKGEDLWGEIKYPEYEPNKWENLTEVNNKLYEPMKGIVDIGDSRDLAGVFTLNKSKFEDGNLMLGEYETVNSNIHLAGFHNDLEPKYLTQMSDVLSKLEEVEEGFYDKRGMDDSIDTQIPTDKQLYAIMNIGTSIGRTYPEFDKRDQIYKKIMSGAKLIIDYKAKETSKILIEIFDFNSGSWKPIHEGEVGPEISRNHILIPEGLRLLNLDNLLFIRVAGTSDSKISLGRFQLVYESDVILNKTGPKLEVISGGPILDQGLLASSSTVGRAIVGYSTMTTAKD